MQDYYRAMEFPQFLGKKFHQFFMALAFLAVFLRLRSIAITKTGLHCLHVVEDSNRQNQMFKFFISPLTLRKSFCVKLVGLLPCLTKPRLVAL